MLPPPYVRCILLPGGDWEEPMWTFMRNGYRSILSAAAAVIVMASSGAALADNTVTLTLWMHEHPPRLPLDHVIIDEFQKQNPNIKVDLTIIPNADFSSKLEVAFAGGAGPDVFNVDSFSSGQYYSSGILAPVDLAAVDAKSNDDLDERYGLGIGGATYGGKIYGFP